MPTEVLINAKKYILANQEIEKFPIAEFSAPFALTTQQRRGDRALMGSWETKNLLGGYGKLRIDVDNPRDFIRFFDSEVETRFEGQITLPLLKQSATATNLVDSDGLSQGSLPILSLRSKAAFMASISTATADPYIWTFTGSTTTWAAASIRTAVAGTLYLYDSYAALGQYHVLIQETSDVSLLVVRSADLTTWTVGAAIGTDLDGGKLWSFGATLLALIYDSSNGTIGVYKSTDNGATWGAVSQTLYSDYGSTAFANDAPRGVATYYDGDGNTAVLVGLRDGVYSLDLTANTNQLLIPLPTHSDNCARMTVWNTRLYVPTGDGGLMEATWTGAELITRNVANQDDGFPAGKTGVFVQLVPSTRWLFGLYGTGTAWTIFAYDGQGWHFMAEFTSSGFSGNALPTFGISSEDDSKVRLHIRDTATSMKFLEFVFDNPGNTSNTLKYEASAVLQLPEFDGGIFEENKGFYEEHVDATNLGTASQEYIEEKYGLDGGAYTANTLGNMVSGTTAIKYGSGAGVSGKTIKRQFTLNRRASDNTKTPFLRQMVLHYLVVPTPRYGYRVTVDLAATATLIRQQNQVQTDLEGLFNTVTLVNFVYEKTIAAKKVKAVPPWLFRLLTQVDTPSVYENKNGQASIYLVELH